MALRSRKRQRGQEPTSALRLLVDLTAFRIAAGILSLFWELLGRRALTIELLDAAKTSTERLLPAVG